MSTASATQEAVTQQKEIAGIVMKVIVRKTKCAECGRELTIEADEKSPAAKITKCSRCGR